MKLPDKSVDGIKCMGSFDCVSVRLADGNFAQDDIHSLGAFMLGHR
jgi:hypothetical protein